MGTSWYAIIISRHSEHCRLWWLQGSFKEVPANMKQFSGQWTWQYGYLFEWVPGRKKVCMEQNLQPVFRVLRAGFDIAFVHELSIFWQGGQLLWKGSQLIQLQGGL